MTGSTARYPRLNPDASIDAVLRDHPATVAVFNAFGVDACCGGARSLRAAAQEDGVDCCALVAALELAAADEEPGA